jgi:PrcB C-terminal
VGPVRWARATSSVVHDQTKLDRLFVVATLGSHPQAPTIDFDHRLAVLITVGPRSSTGYSLHVAEVTEQGDHIDVVVRERTPALADKVLPHLTYPYVLVTLAKSDKSVHVRYAGRS